MNAQDEKTELHPFLVGKRFAHVQVCTLEKGQHFLFGAGIFEVTKKRKIKIGSSWYSEFDTKVIAYDNSVGAPTHAYQDTFKLVGKLTMVHRIVDWPPLVLPQLAPTK